MTEWIGVIISVAGCIVGILASVFAAMYLVKRTAERVGEIEQLMYKPGEGLNVMTLSACDCARKKCSDSVRKETDYQIDTVNHKLDELIRFQDLQNRRWQVVVTHVIRTTAIMEILARANPEIEKLVDGIRANNEAFN